MQWENAEMQKMVSPQNNNQLHSTGHNCLAFPWVKLIFIVYSFLQFSELYDIKHTNNLDVSHRQNTN